VLGLVLGQPEQPFNVQCWDRRAGAAIRQ